MILSGNKLHKQMKITSTIGLIFGLFGLGIFTTSCGLLPKEAAEAESRSPGKERNMATNVDVAVARTDTLRQQPDYIGNTAPLRIVSVRSQIEGRLLGLNLDVGDSVSRGQIVGQIDDALLLTALKQAEAELAARQSEVARAMTQVSNARVAVEKARLEVAQAQADYQRQQKLLKAGAISEQSAQQAGTEAQTAAQAVQAAIEQVRTEQQAVAAAQGRVIAQKAAVAQAQERRSYGRIVSPISGVVTEKVTEPGNLLQVGGEVLKIADFNRVKVVVQVSELDLSKVQVGQSVAVSLDAFPDKNLIGRVTRISPAADVTARLIPVEVVIPNSGGQIGSGLLARVNFVNQATQRVVVPETAINENRAGEAAADKSSTIFLVQETQGQSKVAARAVILGKKVDGKVEILSGLQPGEKYITRSSKPLKDGDVVKFSILSEK
jgi:RND family efflux transporter MFP subunit